MEETVALHPVNWREFFNEHARRYDENVFAQNTVAEIDFFLELFPLSAGATILDMGCGTGRHSVELAKRGFKVTGVDLSEGMLEVAQSKAKEAGVSVDFIHKDATKFASPGGFDAAICLCEGAFGLIGAEDDPERHDSAILENIAASLKQGGCFLLTCMNGYAAIRKMKDDDIVHGLFDPATMVARYADDWNLPEGQKTVVVRERMFIAPEMKRMLEAASFRVENAYGGTAGHWGRRPISLDEIEMMFVCRKV